jgi:hypothetical protein
MMQKGKVVAMKMRSARIAETQDKRRPYDLQNPDHSL